MDENPSPGSRKARVRAQREREPGVAKGALGRPEACPRYQFPRNRQSGTVSMPNLGPHANREKGCLRSLDRRPALTLGLHNPCLARLWHLRLSKPLCIHSTPREGAPNDDETPLDAILVPEVIGFRRIAELLVPRPGLCGSRGVVSAGEPEDGPRLSAGAQGVHRRHSGAAVGELLQFLISEELPESSTSRSAPSRELACP